MSKTNYLEDALLDHTLRNTAYTSPTAVFVGLLTADPTEAGLTTNEVTGGSYARESCAFDAAVDGVTANTSLVTFTTATADWGTVTHFGVFDLVSAGNMLYYGALDSNRVISNGGTATIAAGALDITED